ncbi:serine aminopeptidase domain-containing protein [Streptomyces sp. cg35]|uniref:serine aminopeptidase domain-containing protein n=1 Tax=Streptomyces sp. cg35 TaxID=3421650 RepID=UPI003D179EBD
MTQQYTDHHAPEGLRTRGTVVVVPGRGETRATYNRLGRRLAADAYRVRVVDAADAADLDTARLGSSLREFGQRLAAAAPAADDGTAGPLVLVGSDTGAAALAALHSHATEAPELRPDALVLAGLPGSAAASASAGWEDELDVRTTCPVHRGALTTDPQVRRGTLGTPVPDALLDAAYDSRSAVPHLLLAGDLDPLADHDALDRLAKTLPRARLAVVRGARHDVLNDQQHRAVAAELVTFLEALRADLQPQVSVRASAW